MIKKKDIRDIFFNNIKKLLLKIKIFIYALMMQMYSL